MDIFFLGNCQINAMRSIHREMFPGIQSDFASITPYWGKFDADQIRRRLASADLVVCQAVTNPASAFHIAEIRDAARGEVLFLPYVYLDGLAGLEMVSSKGRALVRGADPLLAGQQDRRAIDIFDDYCKGRIDLQGPERLRNSIRRIQQTEADHCCLAITDYLDDTFRARSPLFAMNHPTQHVLFEMFRRLCAVLDVPYDASLQNDMVTWSRRALPASERALSPHDVAAHGLAWNHDPHWYQFGFKLVERAMKFREIAQAAAKPRQQNVAA